MLLMYIFFFLECGNVPSRARRHTRGTLAVHRVADDLVRVVLRFLPGEQGSCAGVGRGGQVARRAGQTLPHDHRQLGGGACRAQPIVSYALVVARVLQCQLVDEQDSRGLALRASEGLDGLAVLQPVQHRRRLPGAVAHEPGCVAPGEGCGFWGLEDHWGCYWKKKEALTWGHHEIKGSLQ